MTSRIASAARLVLVSSAVALSGPVVAATLTPPDEADAERTEHMCEMATPGPPGKAHDTAVQECVGSDAPNFAYWEKCRQRFVSQHMQGQALSDAVASCMSQEP